MPENKYLQGEDGYIQKVEQLVKSLKYGSITIIVQDGKVIQIEKNEKIRFKK